MSGTGTGSSSSSGSGGNRKIIGFTVKKRIITLPSNATVGPQYCETITEECTPCDGSGTGSGTGSATGSGTGGGGTIATACCENLLPETITGTFTSTTGFATAWPASASFVYDVIGLNWNWSSGPACGDGPADLQLTCNGGSWELSSGVNRVAVSPTASASASCSPFVIVFNVSFTSAYCGAGSYTVTFTV